MDRDTFAFCVSEHKKEFITNPELRKLAEHTSGGLLYDPPLSVDSLISIVEKKISDNKSFSLVRIGNGEGNAFGMTKPLTHKSIYETFCAEFGSQNYHIIDEVSGINFCKKIIDALDDADMIGVRCFRFDENEFIDRSIANGDTYAALGLIYSREYFVGRLRAKALCQKIITSAWIHLDIISRLDDLLALGKSTIIITGRSELREGFASRLGGRLSAFIDVPVQGYRPDDFEQTHYATRFNEVCNQLSTDLSGCVVLVGAGLFGKIYCHVAKQHGAIAIDLGSMFDALCGLHTRPVFAYYDFDKYKWL
ncbi:hypothetical protein [Mesorhizobium sp. B2-3-4]|uniref:GT-D fold domain-containing protein n=1 Tax=Mesorhizobium sp. B2-3-4 TaxID=2589959 RepID=UPI001127C707|nr:hypothetical protein [Mesorhizobium sp. B2-3-4]TPM37096.1 hypothetical protein FJ967_16555 [Mesorhizobium sp. B2-3-4]